MEIEVGKAYVDGSGRIVLVFENKDSEDGSYPDHTFRGVKIYPSTMTTVESYTKQGLYYNTRDFDYDLVIECLDEVLLATLELIKEDTNIEYFLETFYQAYVERNRI